MFSFLDRGRSTAERRTNRWLAPTASLLISIGSTTSYLLAVFVIGAGVPVCGQDTVQVGAGSYLTRLPAGAKEPRPVVFRSENISGPTPTGDWWSSLAWMPYSEPMYAHPLVLRATPEGMRIAYPGPDITANKVGIFGEMPGDGSDLVLRHSRQIAFPDARVSAFSDWFVTAAFAAGASAMRVSFGHGSPFVYAQFTGGSPVVAFATPPKVWFAEDRSPVMGVTVNRRHYALFGPTGTTWSHTDRSFTCELHGQSYFSLALLPDELPQTLERFRRFAYCHVTNTKADFSYDEKTSSVTTRFQAATHAYEGDNVGTLFALYPHQWHNAAPALPSTPDSATGSGYDSVCGRMRLVEGHGFTTRMRFHGILPALPLVRGIDRVNLKRLVEVEANAPDSPIRDTYWDGKWLGRLASVVPIAEQIGAADAENRLVEKLKRRMETWLTAANGAGTPKRSGAFYYNRMWGTLIGYPASYGSDTDLSDHHFHYGYFLRAAAEIARTDPTWAANVRWGGMLRLLQRDTASGDRGDPMFPYLRHFDIYAGHSWASGTAKFGSGNNEESSSEAMNAWTGMALLGEAIGDKPLRDLGIYLYTTELEGINNYWFDVHGLNRPKGYTPSVVTMVWGGKMVNETWFSNKPAMVHGINWMPFQGGSLYLGLYPEYAGRNYEALVSEAAGDRFSDWADLIWMYRALSDPDDALRLYSIQAGSYTPEAGNARANVDAWIRGLNSLGLVDRGVTADTPLYAVFQKSGARTYVVYSAQATPRKVIFSDGFSLTTKGKGFIVKGR